MRSMIHFLVPRAQDFGLREYLEMWGAELAGHFSIVHYEELPEVTCLPSGTYLLSALDQLTRRGMQLVGELEEQLRGAGPGVRVLNSTRRTLLRFELLDALWLAGRNVHRVARVGTDLHTLRYPVFLREEHQHGGVLTEPLENPTDLRRALARLMLRGHRPTELLAVEFCDTKDANGIYRKYAAIMLGSRIVPQYLSYGRDWVLSQSRTEFSAAMIGEETAYLEQNPHEASLRSIFALAGVQWGRIDYALKDGAVETWEINLNPTMARYPVLGGELQRLRDETKDYFYQRFLDAVRALDSRPATGPPIPLRWSPAGIHDREGLIRCTHRNWVPAALSRAIRPVRPLADRMVGALSPAIVALLVGRKPRS